MKYFKKITISILMIFALAALFQNCSGFESNSSGGTRRGFDTAGASGVDVFFFHKMIGLNSYELWKYENGSVAYVQPATETFMYSIQRGTKIYYSGSDADHGTEPWVYNLQTRTSNMLADVVSGTLSGYFMAPFSIAGAIYYISRGGKLYKIGTDDVPVFHMQLNPDIASKCLVYTDHKIICRASYRILIYDLVDLTEQVASHTDPLGGLGSPVLLGDQLHLVYYNVNGVAAQNKVVRFDLNTQQFSDVSVNIDYIQNIGNVSGKLFVVGRDQGKPVVDEVNASTQSFTWSIFGNFSGSVIYRSDRVITSAYVTGLETVLVSVTTATQQPRILWDHANHYVQSIYKSPTAETVLFTSFDPDIPPGFCGFTLNAYNSSTDRAKVLTDNVCAQMENF